LGGSESLGWWPRVHREALEADPLEMSQEAASESRRGRPPLFSEKTLREAANFSYVRRVRTRRGAQDLVYRKFAVAVIELFSEAHAESAESLAWLLKPNPRHSLLSELGRVGAPKSDSQGGLLWNGRDVNRLIRAALEIAEVKPTAKLGVAMIRDLRRRYRDADERDDVLSLRFPPPPPV